MVLRLKGMTHLWILVAKQKTKTKGKGQDCKVILPEIDLTGLPETKGSPKHWTHSSGDDPDDDPEKQIRSRCRRHPHL